MNRDVWPESESHIHGDKVVCSDCGGDNITTTQEEYKFTYGIGDSAVELSAWVPLRKCNDCGSTFLDDDAEDACHEAVCHHLRVMTPSQIKDLRALYGLTQARFSEITKLGEATLSRWERGTIIQNQAYDNYLYLLGFNENLERIRDRAKERKTTEQTVDRIQSPKFRELDVTEELLERKRSFKLVV